MIAKIESKPASESSQHNNPMAVLEMEVKPTTSRQVSQSVNSLQSDPEVHLGTSIFRENNDILDDTHYPTIGDKSREATRRFSDTKLLIVNDSEAAKVSAPPNANRSSQVLNISAANFLASSDATSHSIKNFKSLPNIVNVWMERYARRNND